MSEQAPRPTGRPRLYASQEEFDALKGQVASLTLIRPATGDAPIPPATSADQRFVEECMIAIVSANVIGVGDADLAPLAATVQALVVARDAILANLGADRARRIKQLKEGGYLSWAGVGPE